jgi:hypothetical protein
VPSQTGNTESSSVKRRWVSLEVRNLLQKTGPKWVQGEDCMKYKDIKGFRERCEGHPDHQTGTISYSMIHKRLQEEIVELRNYIEQHSWVGLTYEDRDVICSRADLEDWCDLEVVDHVEAKLKEKNV